MKKIIVIDDNRDILDAVDLLLTTANYDVRTCLSSKVITTLTTSNLPDLFIIDIFLSGENGLQLSSQLKGHSLTAKIPILLISAQNHMEREVLLNGGNDFLSKPFDTKHLLTKITNLINLPIIHAVEE